MSAAASHQPVRRRRRHCVVATAASRRRRRQQQSRQLSPFGPAEPGFACAALAAEEYYVEKILGERVDQRTKQRFFRVRWQGYSAEHDTWEPEANLTGVRDLVEAYRRDRRARQQQRIMARAVDSTNPDAACRRRMGSWEYVPTSELVAKKTRFFDDLAEGRIDVRSDDLYSRVKCRRRQPGSADEAGDPAGPPICEASPEKENLVKEPDDLSLPSSPKAEPDLQLEKTTAASPEAVDEPPGDRPPKTESPVAGSDDSKPDSCPEPCENLGGDVVRETSSDISPPELSPVSPLSPVEAPLVEPDVRPAVKKAVGKPVRRSRPASAPQRRRLVQKVSPNLQSAAAALPPGPGLSLTPSLNFPTASPPPPPPPPSRMASPSLSGAYLPPAPPPPPPACLGAPSIRPEILEKMIDDCMSQNHIPDVNPLLSYMVDDAKTPPPALVSVESERDLLDAYLAGAEAGPLAGPELLAGLPHLRPPSLPGPAVRLSNVQLRAAVLQNNYSLVRALLANPGPGLGSGHDLEQRDADGESLLSRCVRHGHRHMAELLLRHGALTESARRSDGATPLMLAVDAGQLHLTRLLLEMGASPDHTNRFGETCLHRAVRRGHVGLVELLLRWGIDFARVDAHQQTALKCARSFPVASAHPELERMLVSYLQTHNNQLSLTWTAFLAAHGLEAEALLYPPTNFVAVAHCPHAVYRLQLQLPAGANLDGAHILLLVHALPDYPSFFWLNDGPCLVESVALNGTEQRRLGHQWFVSSLHPLLPGATNEVEVRLVMDAGSGVQNRHVRLAAVAMKVRRPVSALPALGNVAGELAPGRG